MQSVLNLASIYEAYLRLYSLYTGPSSSSISSRLNFAYHKEQLKIYKYLLLVVNLVMSPALNTIPLACCHFSLRYKDFLRSRSKLFYFAYDIYFSYGSYPRCVPNVANS